MIEFLKKLSKHFEIIFFDDSLEEYTKALVDKILATLGEDS